jgi:Uma2 family endonuclease
MSTIEAGQKVHAKGRERIEDQVDHRVHLDGATWEDYERLLEIRGDRSSPRITYLEGVIEIMAPCWDHEAIKSDIGSLVDTYCVERGIPCRAVGSWTIREKPKDRGSEPDECYVFGPERRSRPDLAIEVVWTSGGLDKLEVYRKLGVREVWYWKDGELTPYVLRGETYSAVPGSEVLPGIDLKLLASFLGRATTTEAIIEYRKALQSAK